MGILFIRQEYEAVLITIGEGEGQTGGGTISTNVFLRFSAVQL